MPAADWGPVRQIEAGVLDVGYVDVGPPDGPAVVLLHGWPYDIHSYAEVAPALGSAGHRVSVSGYLIGSQEANQAPLQPAAVEAPHR